MEFMPEPYAENLFLAIGTLIAVVLTGILMSITMTYFVRRSNKTPSKWSKWVSVVPVTSTSILGLGSLTAILVTVVGLQLHNQQQAEKFINKLETHYQVTIPETTIREWFPRPWQVTSFEQAAQKPPVTTTLTYQNQTYITDLLLTQPEPGVWELYAGDGLFGKLIPVNELLTTTIK